MEHFIKQYKNLPFFFLWDEALKTTSHVMNRYLTSVLQNITPNEALSGRKPNFKYFRVFGCEAYAHVPNGIRENKIDKKSIECIFMGYDDQMK